MVITLAGLVAGAAASNSTAALARYRLVAGAEACRGQLALALQDDRIALVAAPLRAPDRVPALSLISTAATRAVALARTLPRCPGPRWGRHRRDVGTSMEGTLREQEAAGLTAQLGVTARASSKVASRLSSAVATRLRTRFLILIVLFIKFVVIPHFLCPPIVDGLMGYLGPTISNAIVVPLVQGVIELSQPKFPEMLGKVIGIFLGLILFLRLIVLLTITLGDGIVFVVESSLNRQIARSVINFCNLHLLTAETFMVLHEVSGRVTANVVNRLGLSLTHALTHSVTHTVTHKILHHYYCIYCYYYGNFCDFCYRYDELTYMHRLWGFGQGKCEECSSPRALGQTIAIDSEEARVNSNAAPKGPAAREGVDGDHVGGK